MKSAPEPSQGPISADLELKIIKTVEERLIKLPAETYKLIQSEVESHVAKVEKTYRKIAVVLTFALVVILAGFFKITTQNASEQVAKAIATTQAKQQSEEIDKLNKQAVATKIKLDGTAAEISKDGESLKRRIEELQKLDNLIAYDQKGFLTLKPADGKLSIFDKAGNYWAIFVTPDGALATEQSRAK